MKRSDGIAVVIGLMLGYLTGVFFFGGCKHLTVAPKPVEAHAIAPGETNKPDADVIDCDARGCLVRKSWVDSYFALETKFKENIPADRLIKGEVAPNESDTYRIPFLVVNHDADMRKRERLAEAGP